MNKSDWANICDAHDQGVNDALRILDAIRTGGRIGYGDYLVGDKREMTDINYNENGYFEVSKDRMNDIINGSETENQMSYKIRKLTPLECFRLMGFSDEDFVAAKIGNRTKAKELLEEYEPDRHLELMQLINTKQMQNVSNSQLYKQAGNSIVVDVLYYIYKELYKAMPYLFDDLKVGSYFSGVGAFERSLDRLYAEIN